MDDMQKFFFLEDLQLIRAEESTEVQEQVTQWNKTNLLETEQLCRETPRKYIVKEARQRTTDHIMPYSYMSIKNS
jgi:hypothetical protein